MVSAIVWVRYPAGSALSDVGMMGANPLKSRHFAGIWSGTHINGVQGGRGFKSRRPDW